MTEEKKPEARVNQLAVLLSLTAGDTLAHAVMSVVPFLSHVPVVDSMVVGMLAMKYGPPFFMATRERYIEWLKSTSVWWILLVVATTMTFEIVVSISLCMDVGMGPIDEVVFVWFLAPAAQELRRRSSDRLRNIWQRLKSRFGR